MKIGIDASTWCNRRGYGRFTRELVSAMIDGHQEHDFVLVADTVTATEGTFPQRAEILVVGTNEQQIQAASADGARQVSDMWRMSRAVKKAKFDAFFFPTRYSYFPMTCSTPTVIAFHDATAERHPRLIFPDFRSRTMWRIKTRLALWRANRLATVSYDARDQLSDVFNYPAERITVISEGPDEIFRPMGNDLDQAAVRKQFGLPQDEPLVLYVGGISPHKNLQSLFKALKQVSERWHLVAVGDYKNDSFWGCYQELKELAGELCIEDRITFTGFISDEGLVSLYSTATMLVLPSMSEGFGLPVVEAMACGLPVAASARNSIPEVLGDAGLLFDPTSVDDIAHSISKVLGDRALRDLFKQRGLKRAEQYTWARGARTMVELLESLQDK